MTKISKTIKCLILSGLLFSISCQKAEAFLFPPMPGEPSFDGANNAGKIVSVLQEGYHTVKSGFTMDNALGLLGVKGLMPELPWQNDTKDPDKKGKPKTPGKGTVKANNILKISKDSVDEEEFFNAFHTLFFTLDLSNSDVKESEFRTLYRRKAVEFKQDMAIDTYVTALIMEDYLSKIDKTLDRLEQCQNGVVTDNCTFFGMTMEKIEAEKTTPPEEGDEDNAAQLGAARNAYIVTTVQDRLLRIIEELTALEAIFQASRQIDIANPIDVNEKQSDAKQYIQKTFEFAYNNSYEHALAKGTPAIKFNNRVKMCDGKSKNPKCPDINKDKVKIDVMEETAFLSELPKVEEWVNSAVAIHNLKSMMYQYKTQYRQYLLQKKIHDNAKKMVENSDGCVVNFLNRHSDKAGEIWYGGEEPTGNKRFDYANRKGLSGELMKTYDKVSADITIGTSDDCQGYYEESSCPAGYTYDPTNCCEHNAGFCACKVELITEDLSNEEERTQLDEDPIKGVASERIDTNKTDIDGLIDGTNAQEMEKGSRESIELTWNLGRDALLGAMNNPDNNLKFAPWNDQRLLQEEYLRNKYRNIKLIIEATDQGVSSFKLVSYRAGKYTNTDNPIEKYIKAATSCKVGAEAEAAAEAKWCTGSYVYCKATYSAGTVTTKVRRKKGYDEEGYPIYDTKIHGESQKASLGSGCTYTKAAAANIDTSSICLTPQCLVNNYFPKRWPAGADKFYNEAKGNGRIIAMDKLENVITERNTQENMVHTLISNYQNKINTQESKVRQAIENLKTTNEAIDELKEKKNIAKDEQRKTQKRISSITDEINGLNKRKLSLTDKNYINDIKVINDKITELKFEQNCIKTGEDATFKTNRKVENEKGELTAIVLTCNDYTTKLEYSTEFVNRKEHTYVPSPDGKLNAQIETLENKINAQMARLEELKAIITSEQDNLVSLKDEFAERYLDSEEKAQAAIENKNREFEKFLDPNMAEKYLKDKEGRTYRMLHGKKKECYDDGFIGIGCHKDKKRYQENDLSTTITAFIREDNNGLQSALETELDNTFFSSMNKINSILSGLGVPSNFYVDNTFNEIKLSGMVTPTKLAEALKDHVVKIAAKVLADKIGESDNDIKYAVKDALNGVQSHTISNQIDGENKMPSDNYLMSPVASHAVLLEKLRNISDRFASEKVENLFGIPSNEDFKAMENVKDDIDDAYFVALPARGNNYHNIKNDKNAGRDFIAPKNMLSSLPPLREVFYFNADDYENFPKDKKGRPVLTELLLCKSYNQTKGVCEREYLPEVWLHLLSRPNLREDRKYWQTFVERSFGGTNQLSKLVQNQIANADIIPAPKDSDYRAIIARSGVYPCVAGGKYIDISGGDNIENMQFKERSSLPSGVVPSICQEVTISGNTVTHLLADNKKNQEKIGVTSEPMYEKHSELGQLLTKDLKYRPLQENIQKFLLGKINVKGKKKKDKASEMENNIARQKAERASFKRNAMGSFLDAMTTEYNTRKSLEQSKKTIAETLKSLCEQFNGLNFVNKKTINGCQELLNTPDEQIIDIEKNTLVDSMKLATTYTDNDYYEGVKGKKGEDVFRGIKCSSSAKADIYTEIFCTLDAEKDNFVRKAQNKLAEIEKSLTKITNGTEYVKERLAKINGYIDKKNGSLIVDKDEVTTIRPGVSPAVETGIADRGVEIQTAEEGIEAMANQSQAVAYCPIY